VAVVLALVGLGSIALLSGGGTSNPLVDNTDAPAPAFSLSSLFVPSRTVSLSEFRGEGLVLNFWSSWCVACRIEMPLLESAYSSQHWKVKFLGIDTNDSRSAAQGFLAQVHVTYPCAFDPDLRAASAYGIFGLPVTVFISASGRMLGRHIGQFDAATLEEALRRAFGVTGSV
jgi:thiol-disulfide isomerase/thioredoxin